MDILTENIFSCWIVTEGMAGTENQCLGVAEALGVTPVIKRIGLRQPWKLLSPWLEFECLHTFTGDIPEPPWPDLLIASGRKAIAAARYIKRRSNGKTFTVFLQDPRTNPAQFDLVAVPEHDPLRGDNVVVTDAAPNRVTPEGLAQAQARFAPIFANLKSPRVAVLIGGNSRAYRMTPTTTRSLCAQLKRLDAGIMVTASRRTGVECAEILQQELRGKDNIYFWDGTGENPYFGMLGCADFILVTADSTSMLSEAATTGKPVYSIPLEGGTERFRKFHAHLEKIGAVRPFKGVLENREYMPLNDAKKVAQAIQTRMGFTTPLPGATS